jgi:hypothetical protein
MRRNGYRPAAIQNARFSLLQSKIGVDLHVRLERDFLPQHAYEHAKCIWMVDWAQPDGARFLYAVVHVLFEGLFGK